MLFKMSLKKYSTEDGNAFRFNYEGWDIIVTSSDTNAFLHGIALCKYSDKSAVYTLRLKRKMPADIEKDVANMVGELAKRIAVNFALNCLEDFEDDGV